MAKRLEKCKSKLMIKKIKTARQNLYFFFFAIKLQIKPTIKIKKEMPMKTPEKNFKNIKIRRIVGG